VSITNNTNFITYIKHIYPIVVVIVHTAVSNSPQYTTSKNVVNLAYLLRHKGTLN